MSLFDGYALKARYTPAIIVSLPLILLTSIAPPEGYEQLFRYADQFAFVAEFGVNVVFIILLIYVIREIGKSVIAKRLFDSGLKSPTTEMLLWETDYLSKGMKERLRRKIKSDFDIELLDEAREEEDQHEARLRIREAVGLIRLKVGKGKHTLQYNIRYGFWRNLAGGLPLAIFFSILALCFVSGTLAKVIAGAYLVSALLLAVFVIPILRSAGHTYAEYLFTEYLGGAG